MIAFIVVGWRGYLFLREVFRKIGLPLENAGAPCFQVGL